MNEGRSAYAQTGRRLEKMMLARFDIAFRLRRHQNLRFGWRGRQEFDLHSGFHNGQRHSVNDGVCSFGRIHMIE